jgi:integrase
MDQFLKGMESGAVGNRSGHRFKPSTRRSYASSYRLYIERELGRARIDEIRRRDIQALVDRMKLEQQPSTVRNAVMPLRAYFRWALARDIVAANPTVGLELPSSAGRRDRVVTVDAAIRLIKALPAGDQGLWATWFFAGLRLGESRALRFRDMDLRAREIRVERNWDQMEGPVPPKSKAGRRRVPIPKVLTAFLLAHRSRIDWSDGLVFGRSEAKPFNPSSVTKRADRIWRRAELIRITPHEARHTFASLMIEAMINDQTLNVKVLSEIMGHASITETYDRYGHLLPGSTARAVDALDAYLADVPKKVPTG